MQGQINPGTAILTLKPNGELSATICTFHNQIYVSLVTNKAELTTQLYMGYLISFLLSLGFLGVLSRKGKDSCAKTFVLLLQSSLVIILGWYLLLQVAMW